MSALERVRKLLADPGDYVPGDSRRAIVFEIPKDWHRSNNSIEMIRSGPPPDFNEAFSNHAKELAEMTMPSPNYVQSLVENLTEYRNGVAEKHKALVDRQTADATEFTANIDRLNDEIKTRTDVQEQNDKDYAEQFADIDKVLTATDKTILELTSGGAGGSGSGSLTTPGNASLIETKSA